MLLGPQLAGQFDTRVGKPEEAIWTPPSSLVRNVFLVRPCRPKWQLQLASLQVAVPFRPVQKSDEDFNVNLPACRPWKLKAGPCCHPGLNGNPPAGQAGYRTKPLGET